MGKWERKGGEERGRGVVIAQIDIRIFVFLVFYNRRV